jgi:hypothetical protein
VKEQIETMIQFECENALKPKTEVKQTLQTETSMEGAIKHTQVTWKSDVEQDSDEVTDEEM